MLRTFIDTGETESALRFIDRTFFDSIHGADLTAQVAGGAVLVYVEIQKASNGKGSQEPSEWTECSAPEALSQKKYDYDNEDEHEGDGTLGDEDEGPGEDDEGI